MGPWGALRGVGGSGVGRLNTCNKDLIGLFMGALRGVGRRGLGRLNT